MAVIEKKWLIENKMQNDFFKNRQIIRFWHTIGILIDIKSSTFIQNAEFMFQKYLYSLIIFIFISSPALAMEDPNKSNNNQEDEEEIWSFVDYSENEDIIFSDPASSNTEEENLFYQDGMHPTQFETNIENCSKNIRKFTHTLISTDVGTIKELKYNPAGDKIVILGKDCNFAQIWNIRTKKLVCTLSGHKAPINCIIWHPYNDQVITCSMDTKIKLWDASSGKTLNTFGSNPNINDTINPTTSLAFCPKYNCLLSGSILRSSSYSHCGDINNAICHTSWLNSGELACMASEDGILELYKQPYKFSTINFSASWKCVLDYDLHSKDKIESVQLHDERYLFVRLKNLQTKDQRCKVISLDQSPVPINNCIIADYCAQNTNYLIIDDKNYLFECIPNSVNLQIQKIFKSKYDIKSAVYNFDGTQISIQTGKDTTILEKRDGEWIPIHYMPNTDDIIFNPQNNSLFITTSSRDDIISIYELFQSGTTNPTDKEEEGNHSLSTSQQENSIFRSRKRKHDIAEKDKSYRAKKSSKNQDQLATIPKIVLNNSNLEKQENTNKEKEQEYDPAHRYLAYRTQHEMRNNIQLQEEDISRQEPKLGPSYIMHDLIEFDAYILNKSLIDVVENYPDDIIHKFISCFNGNINEQNQLGKTALYIAADMNKEAIVESLAKRGADVNRADLLGVAPLHISIQKNHIHIIKCLLDHQAKTNQQTNCGIRPLDIARANKDLPTISLLLKFGAAKDIQSNTQIGLLSKAN